VYEALSAAKKWLKDALVAHFRIGDATLTLPSLVQWVPPSPAVRYGIHGSFNPLPP
jgi:hypothetical protein